MVPTKEELLAAADSRFTPEIHEKLQNARVAIAGLGGLGSNAAVMLARCNVGHMLLVDFDEVDMTNLNRQAYGIKDIGRKKTDALFEIIKEINPYLDIKTCCVRVTRENAAELFGDYPIVCEAFDRASEKAMLVNTLLEQCPRTRIVSGSGLAGYGDSNEIRTKRRFKNLYVCGDGESDVERGIGLMAPRVAITSGHEANMIIRMILGEE
ncbi:MAG: sulfur carrier protein ThiS adenylyltransferase ThiF [Clostridia bacterium]|nr:sulfur carrier protein ThiS adenylyltransferase ThiF [Clostridia bacterium]